MSVLSQFGGGGVSRIQRINGTATWTTGGTAIGSGGTYLDVAIAAVNTAKTMIVGNREAFFGADIFPHPIKYSLLNSTTVRCIAMVNGTQPGYYSFEVVEFK